MFKDITDVMLARAYAVDYLFQNKPVAPERPRSALDGLSPDEFQNFSIAPETPKRHRVRKGLAWVLRAGGRALTWTGDRVAV